MPYSKGDPVVISWAGPGIISDVGGGPESVVYHVTMNDRNEFGHRVVNIVPAGHLAPGNPLPSYTVGQKVTIRARPATVTAIDGQTLTVVCDPEPISEIGQVERVYKHVLPAWQLTLNNL